MTTPQQAAGKVLQALAGKEPFRVALEHLAPSELGHEWADPIVDADQYQRTLDIANGLLAGTRYAGYHRRHQLAVHFQQIAVALAELHILDDEMRADSIVGIEEELEGMFADDPSLRPARR